MTKADKRRYHISLYKIAIHTSVNEYYKSCSDAKLAAEKAIKHEMIANNGTCYRIMCGSCQQFTCGYCYKLNDKWYLRVHTLGRYTDYELTEEEVNELYLQ